MYKSMDYLVTWPFDLPQFKVNISLNDGESFLER